MMIMKQYDCVVIGAGVAGMTAALYLKRANLDILLIEKSAPGGQINKTTEIENYPGFKTIMGPDLAQNMYEQIKENNIAYQYGDVLEIIDNNTYKTIKTNKGEIITKYVIIATGRVPRKLKLANEEELIGHGISYCAICDGSFFKNQKVAIVGGGNSALTGALYLSSIASKIYLINRSDTIRADKSLQEKLAAKNNVEILYNSKVTKIINKDNTLAGIEVNNQPIDVAGLFIYIGFDPDISFMESLNNNHGYIIVDKKMQTSINGIYACGDVCNKEVYQIATAIGEAAIAATSVKERI